MIKITVYKFKAELVNDNENAELDLDNFEKFLNDSIKWSGWKFEVEEFYGINEW